MFHSIPMSMDHPVPPAADLPRGKDPIKEDTNTLLLITGLQLLGIPTPPCPTLPAQDPTSLLHLLDKVNCLIRQ